MSPEGVFGTIAELLTWLGLGLGLAFGISWLVVRTVQGGQETTEAELVEQGDTVLLRWLTTDGRLCERALEAWEQAEVTGADGVRVRYWRSRPEGATLAHLPRAGAAVGVLALVFLGLGLVAWGGSIVLMLVTA